MNTRMKVDTINDVWYKIETEHDVLVTVLPLPDLLTETDVVSALEGLDWHIACVSLFDIYDPFKMVVVKG